jgi:hypothetical protein
MESNSTGFSVFPNPTEQTLNVTQDGFIEIFNMQGQRVWSGNMTANQSLDVSSFNAGVYTITARQLKGQSTVRFVKK